MAAGQKPFDDAFVEKLACAAGCFEEFKGVFGGRGVENDEVEITAGVEVVEFFERHVFLHAVERAGKQAVDVVFAGFFECAAVGCES